MRNYPRKLPRDASGAGKVCDNEARHVRQSRNAFRAALPDPSDPNKGGLSLRTVNSILVPVMFCQFYP
jgi:hypothetical protein